MEAAADAAEDPIAERVAAHCQFFDAMFGTQAGAAESFFRYPREPAASRQPHSPQGS